MNAKLLNALIIIVVASGIAIIPLAGGASTGAEPFKSIFLAFVFAIIALQVVPAIMLLGYLIKSLFGSGEKAQESSDV